METKLPSYHILKNGAFAIFAPLFDMCIRSFVVAMLIFCSSLLSFAQSFRIDTIAVNVNFRKSMVNLDTAYMHNDSVLSKFIDIYNRLHCDCDSSVLHIYGFASPEGSLKFNEYLSEARARTIAVYLNQHLGISSGNLKVVPRGEDWQGLYDAVILNPDIPGRERLIDIIRNAPAGSRKSLIKKLDNGATYSYLLKYIFPNLRGARTEMYCKVLVPETLPLPEVLVESVSADSVVTVVNELFPEPVSHPSPQQKPFFMSLHSNMLFDLAFVPNIGAEFYLDRNFSLAANWWYGWWKTDRLHRYWRTYGGYIASRFWFGKAAQAKPLTGHHIGVYAQAFIYDFEWGGTGYLSGTPNKNIFDHPTWGAGVEYGFALPVSRHLNIDFSIGLGYLNGRYWKYIPFDNGYRWTSLHNLKWWGPTKLEVSLVWLLGNGNVNSKKGGDK